MQHRAMPIARTWQVVELPESTAYVPAETEKGARAILRRNCYSGAPVDSWPIVATWYGTRELLSANLLRHANQPTNQPTNGVSNRL